MIVDLKIDRTPAWYSIIAEWKEAESVERTITDAMEVM
jgi:hypothetical protein